MRNYPTPLNRIALLIFAASLPGCVSMPRDAFVNALQAWNGKPVDLVLAQWGSPFGGAPRKPLEEVSLKNGWDYYGDNTVLQYHYNSFAVESGGGASTSRGIVDSMGNFSMTTTTRNPYSYSSNCNVTFYVDKRGMGKVVSVIVPVGDCNEHLPKQFAQNAKPTQL